MRYPNPNSPKPNIDGHIATGHRRVVVRRAALTRFIRRLGLFCHFDGTFSSIDPTYVYSGYKMTAPESDKIIFVFR